MVIKRPTADSAAAPATATSTTTDRTTDRTTAKGVRVRTYDFHPPTQGGMPRDIFDTRWNEPSVAAQVAFVFYCRADFSDPAVTTTTLVPVAKLPAQPTQNTSRRSFVLDQLRMFHDGTSEIVVKGSSLGELHQRIRIPGRQPFINFHAQAVCFAADERGHFYLRAVVGRYDGRPGNSGTLTVTFRLADGSPVGAVLWQGPLDPTENRDIIVVGQDERLRSAFSDITSADVAFCPTHNAREREGASRFPSANDD